MDNPASGWQCGPVSLFYPAGAFDPSEDGRGVLFQWEYPRRDATYVLACDPTVGITGWNIWNRTDADRATDNAAIEVIRLGKPGTQKGQDGKMRLVREPDVQVAEYAAPVDSITCAAVINAIGKLYRGDSEDEGCLVNLEVGPGPGIAVFPELFSRYGYTNLFQQPYLDSPRPKRTIDYGFWATQQSKQLLWTKGIRHIWLEGIKINSPFLLEEMVDATSDKFVFRTSRTRGVSHDDRMTAILLAIWAGHSWTMDADAAEQTHMGPISQQNPIESQRMLVTSAEAHAIEEEVFTRLMEGIIDSPSAPMQRPEEGVSALDVFSEN